MNNPHEDILQKIVKSIAGKQRFLVATHVRPDGDAIGSVLSMAGLLRRLGKQADPYCQDPVPAAYRFLPGAEAIRHEILQPSFMKPPFLSTARNFPGWEWSSPLPSVESRF